MTSVAQAQSLACGHCPAGIMVPAKVRRFSPALVVIGYTVWVPALLALLGLTGCAVLMNSSHGSSVAKGQAIQREELVKELETIQGLPPEVVSEFKEHGRLAPETIAKLREGQRIEVERIAAVQASGDAALAVGAGAVAAASGCGVLAGYILGVPLFVLGLVLTMRRSVWRCQACGSISERA